jgi:hypothetical protein
MFGVQLASATLEKTISIAKLENTHSRTKFSCFPYTSFKTG